MRLRARLARKTPQMGEDAIGWMRSHGGEGSFTVPQRNQTGPCTPPLSRIPLILSTHASICQSSITLSHPVLQQDVSLSHTRRATLILVSETMKGFSVLRCTPSVKPDVGTLRRHGGLEYNRKDPTSFHPSLPAPRRCRHSLLGPNRAIDLPNTDRKKWMLESPTG